MDALITITTKVVIIGMPFPKIKDPSLKATTALNASTPKRIDEVKHICNKINTAKTRPVILCHLSQRAGFFLFFL